METRPAKPCFGWQHLGKATLLSGACQGAGGFPDLALTALPMFFLPSHLHAFSFSHATHISPFMSPPCPTHAPDT